MNNLENYNENIEIKKQKTKLKKSILVLLIVAVMGTLGITLANNIDKKSKVIADTGNYNVIITGNTTLSPSGLVPINSTSDTISPDNLSNYSDSIFISDFTVKGAETNPTDRDIIYDIALIESDIDTNLLNEYLKWELIKNNEILTSGNFKDLSNGERYVLTDIQQDLPEYSDTADSLKLVIWINNNFPDDFDQTTMMNKSFSSTIDVELYTKSKIGQQHPRDTLYYNITKDAVIDNTSSEYVTSSTGIDFTAISSDTNGKGIYIRSGTENDRNPIYYFRGAVNNNNVLFANFCWKIVRTTDTGGIKLIYNGNPTDGKCNNTGNDSQIGTKAFNSSYNSPAYVGYMYGTVYNYSTATGTGWYYGNDVSWDGTKYTLVADSSNTYNPEIKDTISGTNLKYYHYTCGSSSTDLTCTTVRYVYYVSGTIAYYITLSNGKKIEDALSEMFDINPNQTSSTIKGNNTTSGTIDYWYYNNIELKGYNNYIEDTIYCNDRSIYQKNGWDPNGGSTTSYLYFGSYGRSSNPIVTCPRDIDKFTVSESIGNGALDYPVGLLTEDEVRMAGGSSSENKSYYLYTGKIYWLFSPFNFNAGAYESEVSPYGTLYHNRVNFANGLRPVVSLKPNIKLKSGDGTANNPYTVSKPSKSGKLKFVNRQNANSISVGDELKIGTEHFYVVSSNENETVLLAKYNLYVGDIYNGYDFERTISETEEGYGLQNENARGGIGFSQRVGTVSFSDTNYWYENNTLKSEYGSSFPAYVYDSNSNIYQYVESYVSKLKNMGLSNVSGRLLNYSEIENLGCDTTANSCYAAQEWVNTTNYWTGAAEDSIWAILSSNGGDVNGYTYSNNSSLGVRPIIVVPTSQIKQ